MSLILVFHNVQTEPGPLQDDASYTVEVLVGDGGPSSRVISSGRVEHHSRAAGWEALVRRYLDELESRPRSQPDTAVAPPLVGSANDEPS